MVNATQTICFNTSELGIINTSYYIKLLAVQMVLSTCPHVLTQANRNLFFSVSDLCFMENVHQFNQADKVAVPVLVRSGVTLIGLSSCLSAWPISVHPHSPHPSWWACSHQMQLGSLPMSAYSPANAGLRDMCWSGIRLSLRVTVKGNRRRTFIKW